MQLGPYASSRILRYVRSSLRCNLARPPTSPVSRYACYSFLSPPMPPTHMLDTYAGHGRRIALDGAEDSENLRFNNFKVFVAST